jgi:hypothetical protein
LEGLISALNDGAAADFLQSGQDPKNGWKIAFNKFYDREKGAARDYVVPTGQDTIKNFKKKVTAELWPQMDLWCQYRVREILESTTYDKDDPDADDEIPLEGYEQMAMEQWQMYESKLAYTAAEKEKKITLQQRMGKTEQALGAKPPGAFGIGLLPAASEGTTRLTFVDGATYGHQDDSDDSYSDNEDSTGSGDDSSFVMELEKTVSHGQKRKKMRSRKGPKPPAAGDANFNIPSVRGIPYGVDYDSVAKVMKDAQTSFMNQNIFGSSTYAENKERREELRALHLTINHYQMSGDSERVAKLTKKAKEMEIKMFGV